MEWSGRDTGCTLDRSEEQGGDRDARYAVLMKGGRGSLVLIGYDLDVRNTARETEKDVGGCIFFWLRLSGLIPSVVRSLSKAADRCLVLLSAVSTCFVYSRRTVRLHQPYNVATVDGLCCLQAILTNSHLLRWRAAPTCVRCGGCPLRDCGILWQQTAV